MVGTRPYFFSMGQSAGPIRSYPLIPRRAASWQEASKFIPRPNTPLVTVCFRRPPPEAGGGVCAAMAGSANKGNTSLRRMDDPRTKSLTQITRIGRAGKIALDGELDQAHQVVDVQLAHQARPVGIDRL